MNKLISFIVLLIPILSFAQLQIGFESTNQYYINGGAKIKLDDEKTSSKFRSNSYLKLNYNWSNFEFITQVESYLPKALLNFSTKLEKVNFGFVQARYRNYDKGIDFSIGHLYEQFGSGLALRFWEDRVLGMNNSLLGARFKYDINDNVQLKLLAGKQRIGLGFDLSKGLLYGADLDTDISSLLNLKNDVIKLGGTFVTKKENLKSNINNLNPYVTLYGSRIAYIGDNFNLSSEYLRKTKDAHFQQEFLDTDYLKQGNALLINTSYNMGNLGVNLNLRRLENFNYYSQRNIQNNPFLYGTINYIPSLTKQYKYSLQNIHIYQPQFNLIKGKTIYKDTDINNKFILPSKIGDIGGTFSVMYEASPKSFLGGKTGASFILNGSHWSSLGTQVTRISDKFGGLIVKNVESKGFLSFGKKYYSDFNIDIKKSISKKWTSVFSYLQQHNNYQLLTSRTEIDYFRTQTIAVENTYYISGEKSIRTEIQHQFDASYLKNWVAGSLEFTANGKLSFFLQDTYNYQNSNKQKRIHYYLIGGTLNHKTTRLSLSYGKQRSGLICVGGVCRMVQENSGINFRISSTF